MNDTLYHFQISVEYKAFAVFHKSLFLVRNYNGKSKLRVKIWIQTYGFILILKGDGWVTFFLKLEYIL